MNVKIMYLALLLLVIPMAFTIFFGFSWIQYREARHTQQTSPDEAAGRRLRLWKMLLIVSGVLFGAVLLIELGLIVMMCATILFS